MMTTCNWFLKTALMAVILGGGSVQAKSLVIYDGAAGYVEKDVKFHHQAEASVTAPGRFINPCTLSAPLSPYSAYTGPRFYGGYSFSSSTVKAGLSREMIRNNMSATDLVYLQAWNEGGWGGSDLSLHGVFLFKLSEIDSGYIAESSLVDGLMIKINGYGNDSGKETYDAFGRFVLRIGGDLYVSQVEFDVSKNTAFQLPGSILAAEKWALYDPNADLNFNQSTAVFESMNLTNVDAVGFYFEDDLWSGSDSATTAFGLGLVKFTVSFSEVMPAPAL